MSQVVIYCPPTGTTITGECGTTEIFTWSEPSVSYVQFFVPSLNKRIIEFYFDYVSNLGASLKVDLLYYRDNTYITAQTWNLGNLTSSQSLYHYLDFGTTTGVNNYILYR